MFLTGFGATARLLPTTSSKRIEAPGASVEDLEINQEEFFAYSVVRTRAIPPGCAMLPFRSKRK
jgi:hypothetical protein